MSIRWWYSHRTLVALLATATLAAAVMTVLVIRQQQDQENGQVYLEAGGSIGSHPFVPLVVPPAVPAGGPAGDGTSFQVSVSTDGRAACDPEKLISYLVGDQRASEAWVRALNYDRTLSWSGGSRIGTQLIPAYIHELTPRLLAEDLRVTNYQFTNGVALPVQSVLEKGTAILVDAQGIARVRCACGNPLTPMVQLKVPPVYRGKPWPNFQPQRVIATQPGPQGPSAPPSDHSGPPDAQHWQDKPGRPDEPQHTDKPEHPERPAPPDGPERPVKTGHQVDAEQSEYPMTPGKTVNPNNPEGPEKVEKPDPTAKPEKPDKSSHPIDAEQPGRASLPSEPQHSEKPAYPAEMQDPGKAEKPDRPTHAANPGLSTAEEQQYRAQQRAGRPEPPHQPTPPHQVTPPYQATPPHKPTPADDVAHADSSGQPAQPAASHQDNADHSRSTGVAPSCAGHGAEQPLPDGRSGCFGGRASGATGAQNQR